MPAELGEKALPGLQDSGTLPAEPRRLRAPPARCHPPAQPVLQVCTINIPLLISAPVPLISLQSSGHSSALTTFISICPNELHKTLSQTLKLGKLVQTSGLVNIWCGRISLRRDSSPSFTLRINLPGAF